MPLPLRVATSRILDHHAELRARLHGVAATASEARAPQGSLAIGAALLRLSAGFEAHLGFEERELVPRLRGIDAWGRERETALLTEHREQRERLEIVCALAEQPEVDAVSLATEVAKLVADLLADMQREEQMLERLADIDEYGDLEPMSG